MDTSSIMMDIFQHRYYKINKFLLSIIGQWPYQNQTKRRTILTIFIFLVATQIIPQIIAVVEFWEDPNVVIESISPFVIDIACGAKLANIVLNSDKKIRMSIVYHFTLIFVKQMLKLAKHMEIDWMSLTHQPEIHVLHDYAKIGRQFTVAYTAGVYAVTVLFMTEPIIPQILQALKLTDELSPKKYPFPVDYYGIDFDTYYYYFLMHSYICVGAIMTVIIAADTMFIVYVQHACGMFTVVGHQLERMGDAVPDNYELQPGPSKEPAFQQLAMCIEKHNGAIEFADLLETSYTWCFFSLIGLNMLVMSVTGFQTVMMLDDNPEEAIRFAAFTVSQMAHLFFQSFFSQRLMDHSEQVREYMFQGEWYKMSLCAQKLLNTVTMRTYVSCKLTAGKFMVMSLENFTSIVKTSMSYFTLLRSMQ